MEDKYKRDEISRSSESFHSQARRYPNYPFIFSISHSLIFSSLLRVYIIQSIKMKFFATALFLAASAMALPSPGDIAPSGNNGAEYPLSRDVTFQEANAKCGNDAVVSCCNKKSTTGDVTTYNKGVLANVLGSALGGGPGGDGLGLFNGCNDLNLNGKRL
jgi:hypothetical protein